MKKGHKIAILLSVFAIIIVAVVFIQNNNNMRHNTDTSQQAAEVEAHKRLEAYYASKNDDERAGPGESPGLSHTGTDTTIDLGEIHSFKLITEGFYKEVNWYIKKKDETGVGKWVDLNTGYSKANKAIAAIEFSSSIGITANTDYVLTAYVRRYSDKTLYNITYDISIGP